MHFDNVYPVMACTRFQYLTGTFNSHFLVLCISVSIILQKKKSLLIIDTETQQCQYNYVNV